MLTDEHEIKILGLTEKMKISENINKSTRLQWIDAINDAWDDGATLQEIGDLVGLTRQRIHQIVKGE